MHEHGREVSRPSAGTRRTHPHADGDVREKGHTAVVRTVHAFVKHLPVAYEKYTHTFEVREGFREFNKKNYF